jgi:hypothetical protein
MPRNICLAFSPFGSLFLLTSSVSADWVVCLFIIVRLLFIQQPGNTHGIYRPRSSGTALDSHASKSPVRCVKLSHVSPNPSR